MLVRAVGGGLAGGTVFAIVTFLLFSVLSFGSPPTAIETAVLVLFGFVPLGALCGIVFGVWMVLKRAQRASIGTVAGYSAATFALLLGVGAAIVVPIYLERDILNPGGLAPQVEFEIRMPASFKVSERREQIKVELQTDKNTAPAEIASDSPRRDGDRWILRGRADLYYRSERRMLVVKVPGEPVLLFHVYLGGNAHGPTTMSAWQRVGFIDEPSAAQPRAATASDDFHIRYRVDRRGAP